jgi:hypothetical protein
MPSVILQVYIIEITLPSQMVEASRMMPACLDPSFSRDLLLMNLPLLISYANGNRIMCLPPGKRAHHQHKSQNE